MWLLWHITAAVDVSTVSVAAITVDVSTVYVATVNVDYVERAAPPTRHIV